MKKKLILITYDLLNAMHYRQELLDFFGGLFELETHTITDGIGEHLKADAVLLRLIMKKYLNILTMNQLLFMA